MKQILLTLTLLLTLLPTSAAIKKIEANPINIAVSLVEKTDSTKIASTLNYYGYTYQGTEDGYTVMKDAKGNEIRFSFSESNTHYPIIIVKNRQTNKETDTVLKTLNFEKVRKNYEYKKNIFSKFKTECSYGPKNSLIVRRIRV